LFGSSLHQKLSIYHHLLLLQVGSFVSTSFFIANTQKNIHKESDPTLDNDINAILNGFFRATIIKLFFLSIGIISFFIKLSCDSNQRNRKNYRCDCCLFHRKKTYDSIEYDSNDLSLHTPPSLFIQQNKEHKEHKEDIPRVSFSDKINSKDNFNNDIILLPCDLSDDNDDKKSYTTSTSINNS